MDLFAVRDTRHTSADLAAALARFGLRGSALMVASSLLGLGRPASPDVLPELLRLLLEAVGPEGTLILPAYTFSAYKGETFDPAASKGLGSLAEAARRDTRFTRTLHPVYSHLVAGRHAPRLAASPMETCFGPDSFFARFAALDDARLFLLGGNLNMLTIWHLYDQAFAVPWRFVKSFAGKVRALEGEVEVAFDSCVKRLEIYGDRTACFAKLDAVALDAGLLARNPFAAGALACIREPDLRRLYRAAAETDPDYFLFGTKEELDAYYFKNDTDAARATLDPARARALRERLSQKN